MRRIGHRKAKISHLSRRDVLSDASRDLSDVRALVMQKLRPSARLKNRAGDRVFADRIIDDLNGEVAVL